MTALHQNLADFFSTEEARKLYNHILSSGAPSLTPQDAEDILGEAFTRAIRKQQKGEVIRNPANWMYRVTRNLTHDLFRQKAAEKNQLRNAQITFQQLAEDRSNPYATLRKEEARQLAQAALSTMSEGYRDVFFWRHILGASVAETAETLGLKKQLVSNRANKGIPQFKQGLQAYILASLAPSRCAAFARRFPDVPPVDADNRVEIIKHAKKCTICQDLSARYVRPEAILSMPLLLPLPASLVKLLKTVPSGAAAAQTLSAAGKGAAAGGKTLAATGHSGGATAAATKTAGGLSATKIGLGIGALALITATIFGGLKLVAPSFTPTPLPPVAPAASATMPLPTPSPTPTPAPATGVNYSSGNIQFGYLPSTAAAYRCGETVNQPLSLPFASQPHIKPDTLTLDCRNETLTVTLGWKDFPAALPAGISPPPDGALQFEWAAWVNTAGNLPPAIDLRQTKNPPLDYKLAAEFIAAPQSAETIPFDEHPLQATLYNVDYAPNPAGQSGGSDAFASRFTDPQVILTPLSAATVQIDPQAGTLSWAARVPGLSPHSQILLSTFDNLDAASFAGSMD